MQNLNIKQSLLAKLEEVEILKTLRVSGRMVCKGNYLSCDSGFKAMKCEGVDLDIFPIASVNQFAFVEEVKLGSYRFELFSLNLSSIEHNFLISKDRWLNSVGVYVNNDSGVAILGNEYKKELQWNRDYDLEHSSDYTTRFICSHKKHICIDGVLMPEKENYKGVDIVADSENIPTMAVVFKVNNKYHYCDSYDNAKTLIDQHLENVT